ncbi:RNA pyrophosphohydrolase [Salibaculum sp.]|uniref:RNA pyrophosphohydrolase n=1 Tax=Salibaculum sp. TaxID=2855480 RepID=UPI002B487A3A|nr:RNA pyrophosphohydrolase [Salibaculum sp.]HKL68047.1 RNA pyrophosphohydrolase [Salibaculum sp.]
MTPEQIATLPYRPCVGVMLANAEGEVFVGQRIDWPEPAWQMPQGGVDPGEDPRAAALRELEEETGVTPDLVRIEAETAGWIPYDLPAEIVPKRWGGRYRGQEQKWFLMRFLGGDNQVRIETADPEFSCWKWSDPGDLLANIVAFKREVYAQVLDELGARI